MAQFSLLARHARTRGGPRIPRPVSARFPQSSATRATVVFPWHAPFTSEPPEAKSRHRPSARAVIRITVLKKKFVALSGMVSLHANPVNPPHHYISRPALGQRTEDRYHTRGHARPSRTALHPLRTRVKGAKEHALAQIGGYLNHSGGSSPGCSGSSRSSASATACNVRVSVHSGGGVFEPILSVGLRWS